MLPAQFDRDLLLRVLRTPAIISSLGESEWDSILPRARAAQLIARIAEDARDLGICDSLPAKVQTTLATATAIVAQQVRATRWEINRLGVVLSKLSLPVILLKGAAYIVRDFPLAQRRFCGDIDILVAYQRLNEVEEALHGVGWQQQGKSEYDDYYYRRWMHELPPMMHSLRGTVLDVHHAILPRTSRHSPPTEKFLAELWPVDLRSDRWPNVYQYTLSPRDMVLHSAAHLFHDSELRGGVRGLADIHDLLAGFSTDEGFWERLVERASELDLGRSLFYGVRYTSKLLGTAIPSEVEGELRKYAPLGPLLRAMDVFVLRAFIPPEYQFPRRGEFAARLLYLRSHLLRMPLHLLVPHILRKAMGRSQLG